MRVLGVKSYSHQFSLPELRSGGLITTLIGHIMRLVVHFVPSDGAYYSGYVVIEARFIARLYDVVGSLTPIIS